MNYWKDISPKAIAIGFIGGYCVPYLFIKSFAYLMATFGVNQLFGTIPLLIMILMTIIAPLASGYLGARYSKNLPLLNGLSATMVGIVTFVILSKPKGAFIYAIFPVLALLFGYIGARRYVLHG